ncbi:MAG: class I SAM-dependent methyltransferase, partial [Desulfobacterales bacterium]|nr:class I SAM-dependent methyltransferase [Desulfobacterales bacterium]
MAAAHEIGVFCCYDGLPYCRIDPSYRFKSDNLETSRIYYMSEVFEKELHRTDESEREKSDVCAQCSYGEICQGPYAGSDTSDLKPICEPVPNYFVFQKIAQISSAGKNCLLDGGFPVLSPHFKQIAVEESGAYHLFEAESGFFKTQNFLSAMRKGDLYLMNSANTGDGGGTGENGFRCMVKIKRRARCENCGKACPGIYGAGTETIFDLDAIPENLTRIRGEVLDVGFGDMVFEDLFFQRLKGRIQYTGIEPDKQKFDRAVLKYPDAFLINRTIERFKPGHGTFDYILLLGSFNHIQDLDRGFRVMQKALKPHGKLIVIENDIFGLAGSCLEHAWPMNGPADDRGYEHYRNCDMETADKLLKKAGFISCFKSDGRGEKNNFWLIEAEKLSGFRSHDPTR